jgi:DNA-binding LacI/PurR family transcriptional regulator
MRLLSGDDPPDAIFCASDNMALGAMDAARYGLGMQVPHDVSIMGYDDIPIARWSSYDLTTVAQQVDHMVDLTIKLMLDKLEEPDSPPVLKLVPGVMRIRFTVRGANHDFV